MKKRWKHEKVKNSVETHKPMESEPIDYRNMSKISILIEFNVVNDNDWRVVV